MPYLLIQHKTEDYAKWKATFDKVGPIRKAAGEKSYSICHVAGEPNNIVVLNEWDSMDNLQKFLQSDDLKATMKEAGVTEKPEINILEPLEKGAL